MEHINFVAVLETERDQDLRTWKGTGDKGTLVLIFFCPLELILELSLTKENGLVQLLQTVSSP